MIEDFLKEYHKNPRKITEKQFNDLEKSLLELGDLSSIVRNRRSGEVISGNQRSRILRKYPNECEISILQTFDPPTRTGTVAIGYVKFRDDQFPYREVEWTEEQEQVANIAANKMGGFFDFDMLANQFDSGILLRGGFEPFEIGQPNVADVEKDKDKLGDSLHSYLEGNIKQIVLYFKNEEFSDIIPRLDRLMNYTGLESHTSIFIRLLNEFETNHSADIETANQHEPDLEEDTEGEEGAGL